MKKVEPEFVLTWVCPDCNHRNYHHGDRRIPDDTRQEAAEELGVDKGQLVAAPTHLWCVKCETQFEADYGEEEEGQQSFPDA